MLTVLAGDFKEGAFARLGKNFSGSKVLNITLPISTFKDEKVPLDMIASVDLLTEENKSSILGKVGWGAAGALILGPLGLLAGVLGGGNRADKVVVVSLKDGRKVILQGSLKETTQLLAIAM